MMADREVRFASFSGRSRWYLQMVIKERVLLTGHTDCKPGGKNIRRGGGMDRVRSVGVVEEEER